MLLIPAHPVGAGKGCRKQSTRRDREIGSQRRAGTSRPSRLTEYSRCPRRQGVSQVSIRTQQCEPTSCSPSQPTRPPRFSWQHYRFDQWHTACGDVAYRGWVIRACLALHTPAAHRAPRQSGASIVLGTLIHPACDQLDFCGRQRARAILRQNDLVVDRQFMRIVLRHVDRLVRLMLD